MSIETVNYTLGYLLKEAGLLTCNRCLQNYRLLVAILAGVIVVWIMHDWMPVFSSKHSMQWPLLLSVLVWQPFIEELLFRGVIQGQLFRFEWGRRSMLKITTANLFASSLFVGLHLLLNAPVWALSIFIPSLLFGYFRDAFNSVYPSMVLHSIYNLLVIVGLSLHGNLIIL